MLRYAHEVELIDVLEAAVAVVREAH